METTPPTNPPRSRDKSGRPTVHGTGPRGKAWRTQQLGQVSLRLLSLAGRPGGVTAAEAKREAAAISNDFAGTLGKLYERGHVARRMDGHSWRYFGSSADADAWASSGAPEKAAEPELYRPDESFSTQWKKAARGGGGGMSDAYLQFLARGTFAAALEASTEEVGDCLEWSGQYGRGSTARVPIVKTRSDRGSTQNLIVPRLVWMAAHGDIPAGRIVYRHHCCNDRCVLLDHLKLGRRGDQLRRRAALGLAKHMQSTRVALTQAARNRCTTKYSAEQAQAVRELAAAGVPDPLIAGATDVGLAMVADIRMGKAWADRAPAASVFGWRP